jgi:hypothetical protein
MLDFATWEKVAASIIRSAGVRVPVDALEVAAAVGLKLIPLHSANLRAVRFDDRGGIIFNKKMDPFALQHQVALYTAEWILTREIRGCPTEQPIRHVARATMLPKDIFQDDLVAAAWNLLKMQRLNHEHAPAEMIGERICDFRDAVCTVWDAERVIHRTVSPWLPFDEYRAVTRKERSLAREARQAGEIVHLAERFYAVPIANTQRVIVVCEASQLSLRLALSA